MQKLKKILPLKHCLLNQAKHTQTLVNDTHTAQYLSVIFPNKEDINHLIENLAKWDNELLQKSNHSDTYCLYAHLYDEEWLIQYINTIINKKGQTKMVSLNSISQFIKSPAFLNAREKFIHNFFRAKIKYFMEKEPVAPGKRLSEPYTCKGFADFKHRVDCDKYFREHLRCCFTLDGFTQQVIETEIEMNADLWRRQAMEQAIDNYYDLLFKMHNTFHNIQNVCMREIYKKECSRYREYKYYKKHKQTIDRLGLATPNMKMEKNQAQNLKNRIDKMTNLIMRQAHKLQLSHECEL